MARGLNKVLLIGNLGDEPTIRTTSTGKNVVTISMVTNDIHRNLETGETVETAEWHRVVMWNKMAETAHKYLHKGSQIYVEGKLRTRSYMDSNNQKRYTTEIVADDMQMLGSKSAPANTDDYNYTKDLKSQSEKVTPVESADVTDKFDPDTIPF